MFNKQRIEERQKIRATIAKKSYGDQPGPALLLISESLDDYIEHRIETDKVLEGILKDIEGGVKAITDSMVDVRCYLQKEE